MKKLLILLMVLLLAGTVYADVTGSVTNTIAYDADAEALTETVDTSVAVGPLVFANKVVLTQLLAVVEWDWVGSIDYTITDALKVGIATSRGVDSVDAIPLTLTAALSIAPSLSTKVTYKNDNLNIDEVEIGTFTWEAKFSF